jgi:hypothetical protein
MAYTTWHTYLTGTPIDDTELWNALAVLDSELEIVCEASGISYSYATFFSAGVTTVRAALNSIANYLAGVGVGGATGGGYLTLYDDDDPLYDGYNYCQWVMPIAGALKEADFRVETAPTGGDCTLGIYVNGALIKTITIPESTNYPTAVSDCSGIVYSARDVISVRTITAFAAGVLTAALRL